MDISSSQTVQSVLLDLQIDFRELSNHEARALCPAHSERRPSWYCNLETGVHHCFSCGYSGNLASLISLVKKIPYEDAARYCNERTAWTRARQWRDNTGDEKNLHVPINEASISLFSTPPDDKLDERKISRKAADEFEVLWNQEKNQWIFPIRDPRNFDLWGWQLKDGRLYRGIPAGIKKSETLFGIRAFANGSTPVLVESPIDTVRLCTAGVRGGLSSMGVQVSSKQLSIVLGISDSLVLALDNDIYGVEETARLCRGNEQIPTLRIFNYGLSTGKDPGELSEEEIIFGMENAVSRIRWLREYNALSREVTPVSGGASKPISFPKELAGRLFNGIR